MKALKTAIFAATMMSGASAIAAEVSGNVTVASDYFFRGLDQSTGEALSGGLDVAFDSGLYIGTWGSTIASWGEGIELDYYIGYAAGSFDIGYLYYGYPNEASGDLDFEEVYGSYSFGDASIGFAYSSSYLMAMFYRGIMGFGASFGFICLLISVYDWPTVQVLYKAPDFSETKEGDKCDTSFSKGSLNAARRAAGAVCHGVDQV